MFYTGYEDCTYVPLDVWMSKGTKAQTPKSDSKGQEIFGETYMAKAASDICIFLCGCVGVCGCGCVWMCVDR